MESDAARGSDKAREPDGGRQGRVDAPITEDAEREAPLAQAKRPRKALSSEMIGLYAASAGGALYAVGDSIPATTHATGYAAAAITFAVSVTEVVRKRIREKNANRPEG